MFNGKLLFGRARHTQLYIYDQDTGQYRSTITLPDNGGLYDAKWTSTGNIVYSTRKTKNVGVISESGEVIVTPIQMKKPRLFSVFEDKIIYLADYFDGVFESTDDGVNWRFIFKPSNEWHCWQVIKIKNSDGSDEFWSLEKGSDNRIDKRQLCVYKRHSDDNFTWTDVNITAKRIDLSKSSLSFDGNKNFFLSERSKKIVHMLSLEGLYQHQLLSSNDIAKEPWRLAVDKKLLYVGQFEGVVEEFLLTSGNDNY